MQQFAFSLERVRSYREQVLNGEKNKLASLQKKRDEIQECIFGLEKFRIQAAQEMKEKRLAGTNAIELSSNKYLMENTKHQMEDLHKDLVAINMEIGKQLKVVIAASRERTSLDKLEEKQMEEYRVLLAKDEEVKLSEQVMLSLVRKRVNE